MKTMRMVLFITILFSFNLIPLFSQEIIKEKKGYFTAEVESGYSAYHDQRSQIRLKPSSDTVGSTFLKARFKYLNTVDGTESISIRPQSLDTQKLYLFQNRRTDPVSLKIYNVELVKYNPVDYPNTGPFDPYYIVYTPNDSGFVYKVLVSANYEWEFHYVMDSVFDPYYGKMKPIWFSLNKKPGDFIDTLEIRVKSENHMPNSRLNGFTISCDEVEREILITQDGINPFLDVSKSYISLDSLADNTDTLFLHTNMNWSIDTDISWVTITPVSGHGHARIIFRSKVDTKPGIPNFGSILIKNENNQSKIIRIYQVDRKWILIIPETNEVSDILSTDTIDYYSNAPIYVQKNYMNKIPELDEWFDIRFDSAHIYIDHKAGFNVPHPWNTQPGSRQSSIVISTSTVAKEHWIELTQRMSMFRFSPESIYSESGEDTVDKVKIYTDINWRTDYIPQWIEISKSNGSGNDSMSISLKPNDSGSNRIDTIKVSCGENFQHHWILSVKQNRVYPLLNNTIDTKDSNKFIIAPAPNVGEFQIRFSEPMMIMNEIMIFDIKGLKVYQSNLIPQSGNLELSLNNISKGIYVIKIRNALWTSCKYLVVQ